MDNPAAGSNRDPRVDAGAAALDRVLWQEVRMGEAAAPADARARCIAAASAIHSYLMAQRLLRQAA